MSCTCGAVRHFAFFWLLKPTRSMVGCIKIYWDIIALMNYSRFLFSSCRRDTKTFCFLVELMQSKTTPTIALLVDFFEYQCRFGIQAQMHVPKTAISSSNFGTIIFLIGAILHFPSRKVVWKLSSCFWVAIVSKFYQNNSWSIKKEVKLVLMYLIRWGFYPSGDLNIRPCNKIVR